MSVNCLCRIPAFGITRRLRCGGLSLSLLALLCSTSPLLAQGTAKKANVVQQITIPTRDGLNLHATYFPSNAGQNAPVALLLHGKTSNRLVWQAGMGQIPGFAQALQLNDFAVICLDLRLHGENISSTPPSSKSKNSGPSGRDYQAMVGLDLEGVKKFLYEEHQKRNLNMNRLAIVAADVSASVALVFTELDWSKEPYDDAPIFAQRTPRGQDVKALVLISPDTKVPGLSTGSATTMLRNGKMPVMVCVGKKDTDDKGASKKLVDQLMPKPDDKPYVTFLQLESNLRGTDLLNRGTGLEPQMYKFLDDHVKKVGSDWRDRKSPLQD